MNVSANSRQTFLNNSFINFGEAYTTAELPSSINSIFVDDNYGMSSLNNTTHIGDNAIAKQVNYIDNRTSVGVSSLITTTAYTNNASMAEQDGYIQNEFVDQFVAYCILIVTLFGLGGNSLCLAVMLKPPFSKMAHSIMCGMLALVDLAFMAFHLIISLGEIITGEVITWLNSPLCKFGIFFSYLCLHLDANIIVGLSIERVICVFKPLRAAHIITKFKIRLYLVLIFAFFILFNGESAIRYDLRQKTDRGVVTKICVPVYFYGLPKEYWVIKDQVSGLLGSFIPLIIIATCNVALLIKLAQWHQQQAQLGVSTNQNEMAHTNRMIIMVMVAFIVFLSPAFIYVMLFNTDSNVNDPILRILALVAMLNPSLNFALYFLASGMYRKAVKNIVTCQGGEVSSKSTSSAARTSDHVI